MKSDVTPQLSLELTAKTGGRPLERAIKGMMPEGSVFQQCSTCAIGTLCVKYQEGAVCAFAEAFRDMPTRNLDDVSTAMAMLIEENSARFRMARVIEQTMGGGMPSKDVTELSQILANQLSALGKVMKSTKTAKVKGDSETILAKIFGDLLQPAPIELTAGTAPDTPEPSALTSDLRPEDEFAAPAETDDDAGVVPTLLSTLPDVRSGRT